MWSDAHPAEVALWLPGRQTTHAHERREWGEKKKVTSAAGPVSHMCANMLPPSTQTRTHKTKKQCMPNV